MEGLGEAAQWPPSHPTHSTRLDSGRVAPPPINTPLSRGREYGSRGEWV